MTNKPPTPMMVTTTSPISKNDQLAEGLQLVIDGSMTGPVGVSFHGTKAGLVIFGYGYPRCSMNANKDGENEIRRRRR